MNLARRQIRVIDRVDRRVLGAFHLVDALLALPVDVPAAIEPRGMTVGGAPGEQPLSSDMLRLVRNRSGAFVLFAAPFFDSYTRAFENPATPAEAPVSLRIAVADAGPHYLPQEFRFDLPRSLDAASSSSVFDAHRVRLLRAPNAPVQDGWAVLRVRLTRVSGTTRVPLPGVLVRVFRRPRGDTDEPIGVGMTDWRGAVAGEALVPVLGIQRFRPGTGGSVIETTQEIELEATRDAGFTGAPGQLPDVARLIAGTGLIRGRDQPPGSGLDIVPPAGATPPPAPEPIRVQAGRERTIHLSMA